jgi:hypothetical protein
MRNMVKLAPNGTREFARLGFNRKQSRRFMGHRMLRRVTLVRTCADSEWPVQAEVQ